LGLPQAEQEYIVRDPYAATPDGALLCAGMLPEGAQVQIMIGDRSTLVRSAREAAAEAMRSLKGRQPLLALAFSCVSRLSYLGPTAPVEIASLRAVIGSSTPLFGLFSFGEIAARPGSPAHIQNKTVSVGIISET
jgi:hypothetical protein